MYSVSDTFTGFNFFDLDPVDFISDPVKRMICVED